jgi:hypothetical protein
LCIRIKKNLLTHLGPHMGLRFMMNYPNTTYHSPQVTNIHPINTPCPYMPWWVTRETKQTKPLSTKINQFDFLPHPQSRCLCAS